MLLIKVLFMKKERVVASQEVKLFSFIVETMFRRVDLSFVKLGHWSK